MNLSSKGIPLSLGGCFGTTQTGNFFYAYITQIFTTTNDISIFAPFDWFWNFLFRFMRALLLGIHLLTTWLLINVCQSTSWSSGRKIFANLSKDALGLMVRLDVIYVAAFGVATPEAIRPVNNQAPDDRTSVERRLIKRIRPQLDTSESIGYEWRTNILMRGQPC